MKARKPSSNAIQTAAPPRAASMCQVEIFKDGQIISVQHHQGHRQQATSDTSLRESISMLPKFTQTKAWAANTKDRWSRNILSFWTSTARCILHTHWRSYSRSSQATHCYAQFAEQTIFTPFHLKSVTVGNSLKKALCTKQTQDGCDSCPHRIKNWRKVTAAESWRSSSFPHQGHGKWPTQADLKISQMRIKKKHQRLKTVTQKGCIH